jgi:hypothetical protein
VGFDVEMTEIFGLPEENANGNGNGNDNSEHQ